MAVAAKTLEYAVELDEGGRLTVPGGGQFVTPEGWSADHLLLAALVRCSIDSLAYHARRAGHNVTANGEAFGKVTKREGDGRYALVEIDVSVHAQLSPRATDTAQLTEKAERDCFVGASLTIEPTYTWHVS